MTLEELLAAARGSARAEQLQAQGDWERARWLAACLLQPHMKKGSRINARTLAVFPWEKEQPADEASSKRANDILKGWNNG